MNAVLSVQRLEITTPDTDDQIVEPVTPPLQIDGSVIINRLSFTHFAKLLAIEDEKKRGFYKAECMRGNWSVYEPKRQINSLYFERIALSTDKGQLSDLTLAHSEHITSGMTIRDPYVVEIFDLKPGEVMSESHLEGQLLDKLQEFFLEMVHMFCFESFHIITKKFQRRWVTYQV